MRQLPFFMHRPQQPKKMVSICLINKNVNIGNGMCGKNVNFAAIFKFEV